MAENIHGLYSYEIIRKDIGSPASWFVFANPSNAVIIDNLSSQGIYFTLGSSISGTGSEVGYIGASSFRSFDIKTGSIPILGSGTQSVQVIKLL